MHTYTPGNDSYGSNDHRTDYDLFLTDDIRHVVAYRLDCRTDYSDAGSCSEDYGSMVWFPKPAPWLFGASELWAASDTWTSVGRAIDEKTPWKNNWSVERNGTRTIAEPLEDVNINVFADRRFFSRGVLEFTPEESVPSKAKITHRGFDETFTLKETTTRLPPDTLSRYDGKAITNDLPKAQKTSGTLPMETSSDYTMFPFTEAVEVLAEDQGLDQDKLYLQRGRLLGAGKGWVGVPGPSLPILPDEIILSESKYWKLIIGTEGDGGDTFEIKKSVRWGGEIEYEVTHLQSNQAFLDEFIYPDEQIRLDKGAVFSQSMFPDDEFIDLGIRNGYTGYEESVGEQAFEYIFLPHWFEAEMGGFVPYLLALESNTGHLLKALNQQDLVDNLFLVEVPDLDSGADPS